MRSTSLLTYLVTIKCGGKGDRDSNSMHNVVFSAWQTSCSRTLKDGWFQSPVSMVTQAGFDTGARRMRFLDFCDFFHEAA